MIVRSVYRESSAHLSPHPRMLIPYRVRIALELDQLLTKLAATALRIEQTIRRSQ